MTYNLPELIASHPALRQAVFEQGRISADRMRIELPDDFDFGPNPPKPLLRGLGDVMAAVAKPIAMAIDSVAGTNLVNCGGCQKRQETLNKAFPL